MFLFLKLWCLHRLTDWKQTLETVLITFTIQIKYYPAKMNYGLKLWLIVSKVDCSAEKKKKGLYTCVCIHHIYTWHTDLYISVLHICESIHVVLSSFCCEELRQIFFNPCFSHTSRFLGLVLILHTHHRHFIYTVYTVYLSSEHSLLGSGREGQYFKAFFPINMSLWGLLQC